jgi:DNA mismatch endonuclease (patch repair protein)
MARIRKTDSRPELLLRRELRRAKVAFSTYSDLPGTPDIAIEGGHLAVFVHGCFWHGCPHHYRPPQTHVKYWSRKLARNKARDRQAARRVREFGWHTLVIWECQIRRDPEHAAARVLKCLAKAAAARHRSRETP